MTNKSIKKLVDKDLCYQCGTCKSICPTSAIEMKKLHDRGLIYPKVYKDKCINCSKCLKVCPINNIDNSQNNLPQEEDYISIYNSTDKKRFDFTASGGIVTETISYLFKINKINKAIVTGMDKENPSDSKVYIIEDEKDLKNISGSVYQPVSVNEALSEIKLSDKVAFVGLPCHNNGLDLYLKQKPKFNDCFVIKIALICSIGRGKHGTSLTLDKSLGIKNTEEIKQIKYRYGMPPGNFEVLLNDNSKVKVSCMEFYQNTDYIFMPKGCLFCNDLFGSKADMTVGDPWGMNKGKKAMAIVRNIKCRNILDEMVKEGVLDFDKNITPEECIKTQNHSVIYKLENYQARISAYNSIGVSIPNIKNLDKEKNTLKESIGYSLLMYNALFFNSKLGLNICRIIPNGILYKYRNKILGINTKKRREMHE